MRDGSVNFVEGEDSEGLSQNDRAGVRIQSPQMLGSAGKEEEKETVEEARPGRRLQDKQRQLM